MSERETLRALGEGSYEDFLQAMVEDGSLWEWVGPALACVGRCDDALRSIQERADAYAKTLGPAPLIAELGDIARQARGAKP